MPRGLKLAPEDVWQGVAFVLSVRMPNPAVRRADQGEALVAGIRGLRLRRREGCLRALAQPASGSGREDRAVCDRQCPGAHQGGGARDAQAHHQRAGAAWEARGLHAAGAGALRALPRRGRLGGRLGQAGARSLVPGRHAAARQDTEHLGGRGRRRARVAGSARHHDGHRRRCGLRRPLGAALPQDLHPRRCRLGRRAHCDAALRAVPAAFPAARAGGPRLRRDAAAVPHRRGQERLLRARRARQERRPRPDPGRGHPRQARHHAIQGPRRDEPAAAARDDDGARHAPARPAHAWRRRTAPTRSSTCCSRRSAQPTGANGSRRRATWRPSDEGTGARLRRHREAAAPRIHGEGLPRLLDVRDPRPRAAAARGRAETRAAPDHLRDERTQPLGRLQAQEVRAHGRRRDRQVPSARRQRLLRGDGADGAGFLLSLPDRGRAGELGLDRRPEVLRRDAIHRIAPAALCAGAAFRARPGHVRLAAELRRHARGAEAAARAAAERAPERDPGHRGRHGDRHPAAQPARGRGGLRAPARQPRRDARRAVQARQRPGLPDRRRDRDSEERAARDVQDRQRHVSRARRLRGGRRGGRRDGAAIPGFGREGARADRRPDAREEAAHGRGPARRERPRASDAARHHAALEPRRRRADDDAPFRDDGPRAQLPRQHQRHRARRPAARARTQGTARRNGSAIAARRSSAACAIDSRR